MSVEAVAQFAIVQFVRAGPRHHDDVDADKGVLVLAKSLAREPFEAITRGRASRGLL